MRCRHDGDEIAPRTRLAAGEMHLQDVERRGLEGYMRKKPAAKPKLDPFIPVIDRILGDDNLSWRPYSRRSVLSCQQALAGAA
jgi:hypothetical protein